MGTIFIQPERWNRVAARIRAAEPPIAWAWVLARDFQDHWHLAAMTVRGATPVTSQLLRYEHLVIVTEQLTPDVASRRLRTGVVSDSADVKFPTPTGTVSPSWITTEGDNIYHLTQPDWPQYHVVQTLGLGGQIHVPMLDPLTAAGDQPYYPTIQAALAELLYGLPPTRLQANFDPHIMVRLPDRRARIGPLSFDDGMVSVAVETGRPSGLPECKLRAVWRNDAQAVEWSRLDKPMAEAGTIQIDTGEVPAEMWITVVERHGRILDRYGWGGAFGQRPAMLGPVTARIARWLTEGEHEQLEYKQELGAEKVNRSFAETVAAFANGIGGVILIGVTDDATVLGWDRPNASDLIANVIDNYLSEPVKVVVEKADIEDKPVWVVNVPAGPDDLRPYRCAGKVMIRTLGTTREAKTSEIRRLVSPPTAARDYFGRQGF